MQHIQILRFVIGFICIAIPVILLQSCETSKAPFPQDADDQVPYMEGDIVPFYLLTEKPILIVKIDPVYPDSAVDAGIEGTVVVSALIDTEGNVERCEIRKSVPALDQAALDAAKQHKFTPGKYHGILVRVWVSIPFNFRL